MDRRSLLLGTGASLLASPAIASALPEAGIDLDALWVNTPNASLYGVGPAMYGLRMHLINRIMYPVILLDEDGSRRTLSTEADERALERVNRLIEGA